MTDYTKLTDFASKDTLPTGNAAKIVKGTEIDDEFEAIETAVATKADLNSPVLVGTPQAVTVSGSDSSLKIATTAMVQSALGQSDIIDTAQIVDAAVTSDKIADGSIDAENIADNAVGADALNVANNGTAGQVLVSDGDGSFSWDSLQNVGSTLGSTTIADNVTYTNSTDKIIIVYATMTKSDSGGRDTSFLHGFINNTNVSKSRFRGYGSHSHTAVLIVPPGATYKVDGFADDGTISFTGYALT